MNRAHGGLGQKQRVFLCRGAIAPRRSFWIMQGFASIIAEVLGVGSNS